MKTLPVGIQVYSVRDDAARDFAGTMKALKTIGYDGVELAGLYGQTPKAVREAILGNGLKPLSAHVPYLEMREDLDKTLDAYKEIGCEYIVVPYLTEDYRPGNDGFNDVLSFIPTIGEGCNKRGMTLLYHNHDFEFAKMPDGRYALDYMYETIPASLLKTEIDTCWVKVAGEDPAAYVRKYTGRAPLVHLKDFYMDFANKPEQMYELIGIKSEDKKPDRSTFEFRPVGMGLQSFPEILAASVEAGAGWVIVEQDASVGRTPMEAVKLSREYLRKQGW